MADIVGHGNPAMTERYFHASQAVKTQAAEAIRFQAAQENQTEREHLAEWARTADLEKVRRARRGRKHLLRKAERIAVRTLAPKKGRSEWGGLFCVFPMPAFYSIATPGFGMKRLMKSKRLEPPVLSA